MLDSQKTLQAVMDPRATATESQIKCEYVKDMAFAGIAEIMELLDETGWKPWTTSWHINIDAARAEWIDAWHFMMNIANILGMDAQMIEAMYEQKAEVNRRRKLEGYDGVSTKCPGCHRALDDPSTKCQRVMFSENAVWCAEKRMEVVMPSP